MDGREHGLSMWRRAGAAIWAVVIRAKIRGCHGHGIRSKMHLLVDNVGIVGWMNGRGELVVCGGDLCGIRGEQVEHLRPVHTGEALRLGTLERSGGTSNTMVWCGGAM
jgi:hypothetical protein